MPSGRARYRSSGRRCTAASRPHPASSGSGSPPGQPAARRAAAAPRARQRGSGSQWERRGTRCPHQANTGPRRTRPSHARFGSTPAAPRPARCPGRPLDPARSAAQLFRESAAPPDQTHRGRSADRAQRRCTDAQRGGSRARSRAAQAAAPPDPRSARGRPATRTASPRCRAPPAARPGRPRRCRPGRDHRPRLRRRARTKIAHAVRGRAARTPAMIASPSFRASGPAWWRRQQPRRQRSQHERGLPTCRRDPIPPVASNHAPPDTHRLHPLTEVRDAPGGDDPALRTRAATTPRRTAAHTRRPPVTAVTRCRGDGRNRAVQDGLIAAIVTRCRRGRVTRRTRAISPGRARSRAAASGLGGVRPTFHPPPTEPPAWRRRCRTNRTRWHRRGPSSCPPAR